jgi:hypothetical protein
MLPIAFTNIYGLGTTLQPSTMRDFAMAQPLRLEELDRKLRATGRIEGQHAIQLRRIIYATGSVGDEAAKMLLRLNDACSKKDAAFAQLYVEALTDYFVWQTEPKGYVSPEGARLLLDHVGGDGHVDSKTELELVLNVVHWARQCPEDVVILVLDAVRQSVLLSRTSPLGANRPHASIGAGDVAILRKALHAPAGDGSLLVTRREAEMLFALNDATSAGKNDPEWMDFFCRAMANHLLNPADPPVIPSRDEAARRERWLNERGSVGQLLRSVGTALARGDIPARAVFDELDPFNAASDEKAAEAEARATRERLAREQIDAGEAQWLAQRILQDGAIDDNEHALLAFLRKEARAIDPALEPVMARAKL